MTKTRVLTSLKPKTNFQRGDLYIHDCGIGTIVVLCTYASPGEAVTIEGVVVHSTLPGYPVGHYSAGFSRKNCTPFEGVIEMEGSV